MKPYFKELDSWREEKRSAYLYRKIVLRTQGKEQALFNQLANEAEDQSKIWADKIRQAGGSVPSSYKADLRVKIVTQLVKIFPLRHLKVILAGMKIRGMSLYFAPGITEHPIPSTVEEVGHRHKTNSANNLRAAVFGVNDGLVSNASLIFGMIGANSNPKTVIVAGIAGLLAGAFSMAAGEYVSVRSQRELYEYQINLEKEELELYPEAETAELALIYEARGLNKEQATSVAQLLMRDPKHALDTLARDELGLNPNDLVSPTSAAFFSFVSFTIGAVLPLLPYLIQNQKHHLYSSAILTAGALFLIGSLVSLFTGRGAFKSGLRMLLIGAGAGVVTYLIGHILNTVI